jgi:hypothetical protein
MTEKGGLGRVAHAPSFMRGDTHTLLRLWKRAECIIDLAISLQKIARLRTANPRLCEYRQFG